MSGIAEVLIPVRRHVRTAPGGNGTSYSGWRQGAGAGGTGDDPSGDTPSVDDDHPIGGPPTEAYSRVTDPERYSVLHEAARRLLEQLSRDYAVEVLTGPTADEDLARRGNTETTVRLQPLSGAGAPLTVVFTTFPGLLVRFGKWQVEAYPSCGCDACDERPEDLIERLRQRVRLLLLQEGFTETLTHGWRRSRLTLATRGSQSETTLTREEGRQLGQADVLEWAPWNPGG